MKNQWWSYVIVALLSIAAAVAIAGLPDTSPVAATITASTSTMAPDDTQPDTTVADTTEPESTEPEPTVPPTGPTDTTVTETTVVSESTTPDTTEPGPAELPDRSELNVAAANGADVAGAALRMAARLEELGYVDVAPVNGTEIVEFTAVYWIEGFEDAALRLAEDLDVPDVLVGSIDNAPPVTDLPADTQLLVYIGPDRA